VDRLLKFFYALWLGGRDRLGRILFLPPASPSLLRMNKRQPPLPFFEGVNLPWLHYGGDFGANAWSPAGGAAKPENREALRRHFQELKAAGMRFVRWFLLCDGRAGIRFSRAGTPLGPDERLFADIDAALEVAAEADLKIIFVLIDFLWFKEAETTRGVQMRGRRRVVAGPYKQRALLRQVIRPILKRYGRSPEILAWDIVNEPEWATRGFDPGEAMEPVSYLAMRHFIKKTARLVHRYTGQLATVGLANAAGLPLVRFAGLDFYQVHWYDRWQEKAPLERPVPELGLDRPLLLGEFPTKNSTRPAAAIAATARERGYCGALAWSLLATDRSSANPPDQIS
jgi:hypothetical protein